MMDLQRLTKECYQMLILPDEFNELFDFYTGVIFQNQIRARRAQGLRDATDGEILKY